MRFQGQSLCVGSGLLGLGLCALFLWGCERNNAPAPSEQKEAASHHYSPFMLKTKDAELPFRTISFKDVGVSGVSEPNEVLYETLAESLALELSSPDFAPLASKVVYTEELLNPDNHVSCSGKHIYVDVWSTQEPAQWGYSLWSGCSEDERFVWEQLPRPVSKEDLVESLQPLTRSIATRLQEATHKSCFLKSC